MALDIGALMAIVSPDYVRLTRPSKTVKEIFSLFGLKEPVTWMVDPP